jgi:hypothetical protein
MRHKTFLTANAAFAETDFPAGRIFVASHSGSLIGALAARGKARGMARQFREQLESEVNLDELNRMTEARAKEARSAPPPTSRASACWGTGGRWRRLPA